MNIDEKRKLVTIARNKGCTLNGKRAFISGVRNDFASVWCDSGESYEWSWSAVERVMSKGGNFTS